MTHLLSRNASKAKMDTTCSVSSFVEKFLSNQSRAFMVCTDFQECGCNCDSCVDSLHLHQEIEQLKAKLAEKEQQIVSMESQILTLPKDSSNEEAKAWREKYSFCDDKYKR